VAPHQAGNHPALSPAITPAGFSPFQLRQAYNINTSSATGAGQTIAIVDAFNDPKVFSDLDTFDQQFSTTAFGGTLYQQYGAASSFLTVYNQNGQVINPTSTSVSTDQGAGTPGTPGYRAPGSWEVEESLDVQWAHAVAPGAKIVLVEANDNSGNLYTAVSAAARIPGVSAVSMSWGGGEFGGETASDSTFTTPAGHTGVTFLASTGDNSVGLYPAFSPNVVAVGGTTLTLNADNSIKTETAWSTGPGSSTPGTGGGYSSYEREPSYQLGFQAVTLRTAPDVAFDADPNTGVAIYDSFGTASNPAPGWEQIGGTSLATPAWAGLIAMANQQRAQAGMTTLNATSPTQTQSLLYTLSNVAYHEITSGSITANGRTFTAHAGYDFVTGLGTPYANRVVDGLSGTLDLMGDQSAANQNDTFVFNATSSGGLQVTTNGSTMSFAAGVFRNVNLNTGGGSNSVQVQSLPGGLFNSVALNLDTLTSGHNDTVTIGNGSLASVAGQVHVSNSSGHTSVTLNDSADTTHQNYALFSGFVAAPGSGLTYSGDMNSLTLLGGSGGNRMDVYNTASGVPVNLNAGSGTNSVFVHNANSAVSITGNGTNYVTVGADGSLTGITAPVNVSNSSNGSGVYGKSFVTINDSNDTVGRAYTITSSSVAVQGLTTINLSSTVAGTTINDAVGKANAYTVNSVLSTDPVTINGDTLDTLSGPADGQVAFHSTAHS
jgi:subtilase family serine protease